MLSYFRPNKGVATIIEQIKFEGFTTYRAIRDELNNRAIPSYREGGRWHLDNVYKIILRMQLCDVN